MYAVRNNFNKKCTEHRGKNISKRQETRSLNEKTNFIKQFS